MVLFAPNIQQIMRFNFHLPEGLGNQIKDIAKADARSVTHTLTQLLTQALKSAPPPADAPVVIVAPKPTPKPPQALVNVPEIHIEGDCVWLQARQVARAIGIPVDDFLVQTDEEDIRTIGGENCVDVIGISAAISVAKQLGVSTQTFERWWGQVQQEHHNKETV